MRTKNIRVSDDEHELIKAYCTAEYGSPHNIAFGSAISECIEYKMESNHE